jgi:hypothetical protein
MTIGKAFLYGLVLGGLTAAGVTLIVVGWLGDC